MARLDVTDLLLDPDFIDTFPVVSGLVNVNAYGIAELVSQAVPVSGSVQPANGQDLIQFGEGDMVSGALKIFTTYPLTTGDADRAADHIVWDGAVYTVTNVQSYRNFAGGRGHVEALAKLASLNPSQAPRANNAGYFG